MIQFLRFTSSSIEESRFDILSGRDLSLFFIKRAVYLVLFVYCTLFLAAALPFVKTPFIPVYFLGAFATSVFLIRFINYIVGYARYGEGSISVSGEGVLLAGKFGSVKIPVAEITYLERNYFGNLLVRRKDGVSSFPLMLLKEDDRAKLISLFQDLAPRRTVIYGKIWDFTDAIVVALVLAVHIIQFLIQAYYIPTGSMEDTLKVGDHLFVEKVTYGPIIPRMLSMKSPLHLSCLGLRDIQKGDIVIFRPPHDEDKDYIKRCIAVPGDLFEIKDGRVYLNGKPSEEPYVKGFTKSFSFGVMREKGIEGVVPPGKLVVLGDNRENSQDGRFFGYLDIERIKGRAFILYWNTGQVFKLDFSRFGLIR
ncbi:MAG: signal peptidase I [Chrysiogenales bacterium]|nr:MAG: signal peptidase I [Chrysiogenales bacterium]